MCEEERVWGVGGGGVGGCVGGGAVNERTEQPVTRRRRRSFTLCTVGCSTRFRTLSLAVDLVRNQSIVVGTLYWYDTTNKQIHTYKHRQTSHRVVFVEERAGFGRQKVAHHG